MTQASADATATLERVVTEQVDTALALLEALGDEGAALEAGDAGRLNAAGAEKARLVEDLELLERERLGLTAEARGDGTARHWGRLLGLLEQCRERNARNGALVAARRAQIQAALELLRGGDACADAGVYDARGQRHETGSLRGLGRA